MGVQNTSEFEIKVDGRPINNYASCRCLTGLHAGGCCCSSAGGLGVWQYQLWSFNLWYVDFLLKKEQIQRKKNSNVIMASLNTSKKFDFHQQNPVQLYHQRNISCHYIYQKKYLLQNQFNTPNVCWISIIQLKNNEISFESVHFAVRINLILYHQTLNSTTDIAIVHSLSSS